MYVPWGLENGALARFPGEAFSVPWVALVVSVFGSAISLLIRGPVVLP